MKIVEIIVALCIIFDSLRFVDIFTFPHENIFSFYLKKKMKAKKKVNFSWLFIFPVAIYSLDLAEYSPFKMATCAGNRSEISFLSLFQSTFGKS